MEFGARFSRDNVTLTRVPEGYGKKGFMKRLPAVLAKRSRKFIDAFLGYELEPGTYTVGVEKYKAGEFVVGEVSFGNRVKKDDDFGENEVLTKTKVLINRKNGMGLRLCFIPDELVGKRVDLYFD